MKTPETSTPIRRRDPVATRAAILETAERLFLQDGFEKVSTSRIAGGAGVTKSLIHHHFGSKEALWDEVKRRQFEEYFLIQKQMLLEAVEPSADLLRQSMREYFYFLKRNPQTVRLMSWRILEGDSEVCSDLEDDLFSLGEQRIREAQAAGALRADVEPLFFLKGFLALCLNWFQGRSLLCARLPPSTDWDAMDEAYFDQISRLYFEGAIPR